MKLEDQVVSLDVARELAEKMKGVGIEIETAFYYQRIRRNRILNDQIKYSNEPVYTKWQKWELLEAKKCDSNNAYKQIEHLYAPTLTEMLNLLPEEIARGIFIYSLDLNLLQYNRRFETDSGWLGASFHGNFKKHCEKLTATACAKLYIWLIDNGYVGGVE